MNRETKTRIVTNANGARTKMIADRDVAVVADTVDAVEAVADIAEEVAEEEVVADQEDGKSDKIINGCPQIIVLNYLRIFSLGCSRL